MHRILSASFPLLLAVAAAAQNTGVTLSNQVDGYIEVPYSNRVVPQSGITIEAWITYDDSTIPLSWCYPTIVRQGVSVNASEDYFLRVNADNVAARRLRWKVVTASNSVNVDWTFAAGQLLTWTHVAATYDGATAALYINGALVASAAGNGTPIRDAGSEVFRIGKGSDVATPIEVWNGSIDEVRLWPFARTAQEIAATMNMELASVPGYVSTWNLDNGFADSSGTLNATGHGSVPFTANTLNLPTLLFPPAVPFGSSTPGCLGPLAITFGSMPKAGNLAFALVCTRTQPNGPAFLLASLQPLTQPLAVLGAHLWLDPSTLVSAFTPANALGAARTPLPIPASVAPGTMVNFQYGFLDSCGPAGITASDAVGAIVLP
jgi:hypothetical protein